MEIDSTLPWVALVISGFCFALVSLVEASLLSVRRERVQMLVAQAVGAAEALEALNTIARGPAWALSILRYLFIALSLSSSAAVLVALDGVHWLVLYGAALAVLALLGLVLAVSYSLARVFGETIALRVASQVLVLTRVLGPMLAVEDAIASRVDRIQGEEATDPRESLTDELGLLAESNGDALDEREARMIRGVVALDQTTAREIMVPRVDMVAVELGTPLLEMIDQMLRSGHSRLPVHAGDLDHIEGIVYSRDLLGLLSRKAPPPHALKSDVVRSALFIPETKTLEELLNEFQERQLQIAIVVDEYGGVAGLVTIEDLLEEIVGEIHDEFDVEEPEIETVSDREFLMDARVGIDQIYELLQVTVEGDGFDTVGGFVYERLGRIPSSGDVVEHNGLVIEVVSTVGRRLKKLRVTKTLDRR